MLFLWVAYNRAMRRRSFLAAIAAAFVAPDPEKLLWVPGKKMISVPAPVAPVAPVALVPVSWEAVIEDVTSLADGPWRNKILTGYFLNFSDGSRRDLVRRDPYPLLDGPRQRFNRAS